ncbi:DUF2357 domain-containing protein [Kiritimatiellaeota bacterium B1221]|nr:DUF2357 domain-containing protein [Kiritimatiellaeota bacterium B1221]
MWQLKEDSVYEYLMDSDAYSLRARGMVKPSRFKDGPERGRIETGSYVGLLTLELWDRASDKKVSEMILEIRSRKMSYEKDYPFMLEEISERCSELLMELRSPVNQYFKPEETKDAQTLVQRLSFLKGLLGTSAFQNALHRIITMPNTIWKEDLRRVSLNKGARIGRYEARQLTKGGRRMNVPQAHPLYARMVTVPEKIEFRKKQDSVDTPENRFVKHALTVFSQTLTGMRDQLVKVNRRDDQWILDQIKELCDQLEESLSCSFFKEVSRPDLLHLGSPVLQRKEGYREVLRAWLQFELSARLCWQGGDDVYQAGKKDVAVLYEYWVFFKLMDLVAEVFEFDAPLSERLITQTKDGFGLKLKAGRHTPLKGRCKIENRELQLKLSYNRTFARHGEGRSGTYPAKGSWTERMRPDYTISLWPACFSEMEAEAQELISHVHFDAKYRIDHLKQIFGTDDADLTGRSLYDDLDQEAEYEMQGSWKRADLLKMHAYRDAIRRSAGAYILYPGDQIKAWSGFHEVLPGLGAFPLRPSHKDNGTQAIKTFLLAVAQHVCNRASQQEQHSFHTYRIHKQAPPHRLHETLPELTAEGRSQPATEIFVLPGWKSSEEQLRWILASGLYNYRTDDRRGSLRLKESVAGASYIYLHGSGEYKGGGQLFKVVSEGPRVFSRERLLDKGYPGTASQPFYLVYELKNLPGDHPLVQYDWDLSKVEGIGKHRASALPSDGIPLNEFMKGAKRKRKGTA